MTSRIKPLDDAEWPEAAAGLRDGFAGRLNVYRVRANHPDLLLAWAPLRAHVVQGSALGPERSEVVILRTGLRLGSDYEWAHHVSRARRLGFDDSRIAALKGHAEAMAPDDALLARAVDELLEGACLTSDTQEALLEGLGPEATLDVMATVGFYSVLAFVVKSFDPPLDDDVAAKLAQRPAP